MRPESPVQASMSWGCRDQVPQMGRLNSGNLFSRALGLEIQGPAPSLLRTTRENLFQASLLGSEDWLTMFGFPCRWYFHTFFPLNTSLSLHVAFFMKILVILD